MMGFTKNIVLFTCGLSAILLFFAFQMTLTTPKMAKMSPSDLNRDAIKAMVDQLVNKALENLPEMTQHKDAAQPASKYQQQPQEPPQQQEQHQHFEAAAPIASSPSATETNRLSTTNSPPKTSSSAESMVPEETGTNNAASNRVSVQPPDIYNKEFIDKEQPDIREYVNQVITKIKHRQGEELLPKCTAPQNNFVYLKNHKCASDTMSAVFRRYGYVRNLALVQPVGMRWNIGWPYWLNPTMYRPGKTGTFNILTEHTVYNETYMRKIMAPDSVYITSIREPFAHLKSAFYFFGMSQVRHIKNVPAGEDLILAFLNDKDGWDDVFKDKNSPIQRACIPQNFSVTKNMMSFDLGLPTGFHPGYPSQENNMTYIMQWLEHLDSKYDMVMLVEYFHESLVMLKRMMCWTAKDVIYLKLNARGGHKPSFPYPPDLIDDFLRWTLPDTLLYAHFNRTFWDRVQAMGRDDFFAEVADLNAILDATIPHCEALKLNPQKADLAFPASKWNAAFTITAGDCGLIMSKLGVRQELRDRYDNDPRNLPQPAGRIPGC